MSTYRLTLIAVLAAMATVGRFFLQHIPNVQPVTAIIILSAFFLGPFSGFLLAFLTTYLTNLALGMGIWTLWQILAWSLIGVIAGLLGKIIKRRVLVYLTVLAFFSGFLFGFFFAVINYIVSGKFLGYYLLGLPFDFYHALSNVLFIILLYRPFSQLFAREFDRVNQRKK
ncbi:membrane protein [Halolactibacillus miurensis]|nr:ECF transporter S component [Halolactibacillus miurensis]GEM04477.1 membrane protein [Halolactibacillus miurensis]